MDLNALDMDIRRAVGVTDMATARQLFSAYLRELGVDLSFQGVEAELADLPGLYREPSGVILLAESDGLPVGVVALKPLSELGDGVCEMKRLYVRPSARETGVAEALCRALEAEASMRGYRMMKLDTLARLKAANALYDRMGFSPCAAYNDNPLEDIRYFEKPL